MKFFPNVNIVEYQYSPTFEVLFDIKFPDIATISFDNPTKIQSKLRNLGYDSFEIENSKTQDIKNSETEIQAGPVFHFISNEKRFQVILDKNSIAIAYSKKHININCFQQEIKDVLNVFISVYDTFGVFTGVTLVSKNIINKTFIPNLDIEVKETVPQHIFPELYNSNSEEISAIRKVCMLNYENIRVKAIYIYGNLTGNYAEEYVNSELSYIIDVLCNNDVTIRSIEDVSKQYNTISQICWNVIQYSIADNIQSYFTE